MDGISLWLLSYGAKLSISKIVETVFSDDLAKQLESAIEHWRAGLPADAKLSSREALFPSQYAFSVDDTAPAPQEIYDALNDCRIPDVAEWETCLLRQWTWVTDTIPEPQPFFQLSESEAGTHIHNLAVELHRVCQHDSKLFQSAALENQEALADGQREIGSTVAAIWTKVQQIDSRPEFLTTHEHRDSTARTTHPDGKFHASIDEASTLNWTRPDVAISKLTDLRNHHWGELTARERFRVIANLGHAHDAKGDSLGAAKHFIQAVDYQPDDEKALCLEAVGHFMLGDREKSHELTREVRSKFPNSDMACGLFVKSHPANTPFQEIESAVPEHLRHQVETASSLCERALRDNCFEEAEQYARDAYALDNDSRFLKEQLGRVLVTICRHEVSQQFSDLPQTVDTARSDEAKELLQSALDMTPQVNSKGRAWLRFHIGCVDLCLGDHSQAEDHFHAAFDGDKDEPEYAFQYAMSLSERNVDRAIALLVGIQGNDVDGRFGVMECHLRTRRKSKNDFDEAEGIFNRLLVKISEYEDYRQAAILDAQADLAIASGGQQPLLESLDALTDEIKSHTALSAIRCRLMRSLGDRNAGLEIALAAFDELDDAEHPSNQRRLAVELAILREHRKAVSIWKSLLTPNYVDTDAPLALWAAMQCKDVGFVIDFCSQLRANGVIDQELVHIELDALQAANWHRRAWDVIEDTLGSLDDDKFARELILRRSCYGHLLGDSQLVETDVSKLPHVHDVTSDFGFGVVQVLRNSEQTREAIDYAYELLRNNFDSALAHKALIIAFSFGVTPPDVLPEHTKIGPGCAVRYRELWTDDDRWIIIEDGPNPDSLRNEYAEDHPRSVPFIGASVGDTVVLSRDPFQERKAEILQIIDKRVFRFLDCREEFQDRFHDEVFLWTFRMQKDENGKPDIAPLIDSLKKNQEQIQKRDEIYRNNPLSVSNFALFAQVTVFDATRELATKQDMPIRCCAGSRDEWDAARAILERPDEIILHESALTTLWMLDEWKILPQLPSKLLVSEGTLINLRTHYFHTRHFRQRQASGSDTETTEESDIANDPYSLANFERFLALLSEVAGVVEGIALYELSEGLRLQMTDCLDQATAETLAIASYRKCAIWADDYFVASFAMSSFGVSRIWTQVVLEWGGSDGLWGNERVDEAAVSLTCWGYEFTRLSSRSFVHELRARDWEIDHPRIVALTKWLSNPNIARTAVGGILCQILPTIARESPSHFKSDPLVLRMLEEVSKRSDGLPIIKWIARRINVICGVDYSTEKCLKHILDVFLASKIH